MLILARISSALKLTSYEGFFSFFTLGRHVTFRAGRACGLGSIYFIGPTFGPMQTNWSPIRESYSSNGNFRPIISYVMSHVGTKA